MGGMFSLSDTTMVICSKWLMTKVVNITLWAMFCLGGKELYTGKSFLFCPRLNPEYAVWLGKIQPPSYFKVCLWITLHQLEI